MWITIAGLSYVGYIDAIGELGNPIQLNQTTSDSAPHLSFDVRDNNAVFNFNILDEVIAWNEAAPPEPSLAGHSVIAPPSHNLVQDPSVSGSSGGAWATTGVLSIISGFPGSFPVVTFSNTTYTGGNNYEYVTAITPPGYIHATQTYMFSLYCTISTPLTNALCVMQIQFQDGTGTLLGSPTTTTFSSTTGNVNQRVNITATAPTGAYYAQIWFGGKATTSGTNSGTISFGTPQLEPMYFTAQGVSYPTPDCNYYQADCASMPDGTISRAVRLFSGYISDRKKTYIGSARTWQITCAGGQQMLDDGFINKTYTNYTDAAILQDIVSTYFATTISVNAANIVLPSPIVTGATIPSVTYNDNSLREVLNGHQALSQYIYFLDQYYRLNYQPQFSATASFALSDSPDNVSTFPYYAYTYEDDGTQLERMIKVNGGNFTGSYTDTFSGNGSTKQFTLTFIPYQITLLTVTGTKQKQGVYGRDTLGSSYDVVVNTQSQYILFNTAPPNSANNVVCSYTYKAPITTQVDYATGNVVAPPYTQPAFNAKINDTNIVDLTTATDRGLAEVVKAGNPLTTLTCSSQQYAPSGVCIYFTSVADNIVNQPYVVQSVSGTMIGKSQIFNTPVNEFTYTLGAYVPNLIDHFRNTNKALNRSVSVANSTAFQQLDFVAIDMVGYRDSITATLVASHTVSVYGTGIYGSNAYNGVVGTYGNTNSRYGQGTVYG
jgi:hypothetical protein